MKRLTVFLCTTVLLFLGIAGSASALTFTLDNYTIALNTSDPGLVVDYSKILGEPHDFDLALGDSVTVNLFRIWTDETTVNGDDTVPKPITVGLNFSAPPPPFGGDVDGVTYGESTLFGFYQEGEVEWNGPAYLNFGPLADGILIASLSDEDFNEGYFGLNEGYCKGAIVELTLKYEKEATPVPEPATMLLLGTGLFGLAAIGRKRFIK